MSDKEWHPAIPSWVLGMQMTTSPHRNQWSWKPGNWEAVAQKWAKVWCNKKKKNKEEEGDVAIMMITI
jgi:hypothetical protein